MKYSILVSDFDDTLLRDDRTISKRNIDAIKRYRDAGGMFTICSGRTYESICIQMEKLGLVEEDIPILALQGAIIKTSVSKKVLLQEDIDNVLALEIARSFAAQGVYFHIYVDGQLTVDKYCDLNLWYSNISGITRTEVGNLCEFIEQKKPRIQKLLAISDKATISTMEASMRKIFGASTDMYISKPEFLEFTSPKAGKGKAIQWLAKFQGVNIANVVAIGDSMNDYTMLAAAGVGVAVSNCVPQLRDVANLFTASNNDDGVAEIIDKILDGALI